MANRAAKCGRPGGEPQAAKQTCLNIWVAQLRGVPSQSTARSSFPSDDLAVVLVEKVRCLIYD